MKDGDFKEFFLVWDGAARIYDKEIGEIDADLAFAALADYSLEAVRWGITAHFRDPRRGQYPPKPADVIHQLERVDPCRWPEPDEVWARVPKSESDTAILCDEMARALDVARPLITAGDMVAARRAFITSYQSEVDEAKAKGVKPKYWISPGTDPRKREQVVMDAFFANRISQAQAHAALPHLSPGELHSGNRHSDDGPRKLLEKAEERARNENVARKHLAKMRELLTKGESHESSEGD